MIALGLAAAASRSPSRGPSPSLEVIVSDEIPSADDVVAVVLADMQGPVHLVVGDEVVRIDRIGGAYRVPAALLDAFRALVGVPADA